MNNNLPFLPIELQNIIISYTRPVYPFIREFKDKEEEKQKEIDRRIKLLKRGMILYLNSWGNGFNSTNNTDISFIRYVKNREYFSKLYQHRYNLTGDTEELEFSIKIARSGGSINYFKKVKREKRQKEIERKFKFMIDYWEKNKYSSDYEWNPDGEDKGSYINLGLKHTKLYYEYSDYIYEMKRKLKMI